MPSRLEDTVREACRQGYLTKGEERALLAELS